MEKVMAYIFSALLLFFCFLLILVCFLSVKLWFEEDYAWFLGGVAIAMLLMKSGAVCYELVVKYSSEG